MLATALAQLMGSRWVTRQMAVPSLMREVTAVNDQVVAVIMSGRPLVLTEVAERSEAVVQAWHLGSQAGHAIADVLFGAYNPSGKLPVSFPRP